MSQRDGDAVTLRRVSRRYGSGGGAVRRAVATRYGDAAVHAISPVNIS